MDDFQNSMMEIFSFETNQFLESLEKILMDCENGQNSLREYVPEIFRIMHTIKSSSAMMSLDKISLLAHTIEDLFFYIRENNPQGLDETCLTDIILDSIDYIRHNMDSVQQQDPGQRIATVKALLEDIKNAEHPPQAAAPPAQAAASAQNMPWLIVRFKENCQMIAVRAFELITKLNRSFPGFSATPEDPSQQDEAFLNSKGLLLQPTADQNLDAMRELLLKSAFVLSVTTEAEQPIGSVTAVQPDRNAAILSAKTPEKEETGTIEAEEQKKSAVQHGNPAANREAQNDAGIFVERRQDAANSAFVSVAIPKLDYLVDLAGEIVVAQLMLANSLQQHDAEKAEHSMEMMKKLILQMQEAALSVRMVPLTETFHRLARIVRDISRKLGKDIQFITQGEETEVDKNMIAQLFSPLMHIIRNSADHGIEDTQTRLALGKPAQGKVTLSACTQGRKLIVRISDDGRGFDRDRIRSRAVEQGMLTEQAAQKLSEEDVSALVFKAGFSTKQNVTEFSGRGVGMDVVTESMKALGGKVTVQSTENTGTDIILNIPLTLAIIEAVIVRTGSETCAVPLQSVREIFSSDAISSIRNVNNEDTVLLRGNCYRLFYLSDFYRLPCDGRQTLPSDGRQTLRDGVLIAVQGKEEEDSYLIAADEILDHLSIIVKPVPAILRSVAGLAGCTILGDGKISVILDTAALDAFYKKERTQAETPQSRKDV